MVFLREFNDRFEPHESIMLVMYVNITKSVAEKC